MKIFCNFCKFNFSNFKAIPDTFEGGLNNGKERYKPTVSNVSDCEIPPGSLYDLLQGLSMFLECEHGF